MGQGEAYLFGGARGSVWFVEVDVDMFAGVTRQVAVLKRGLDVQSYDALIGAPAGQTCTPDVVVGFSWRAAGRISLNRFFSIPDTCLFSLNAGVSMGNTFLIYSKVEGAAKKYRVGFGQRQTFVISGDLICVLGFDAEMGLYFGASIDLPIQDFTSLDSIVDQVLALAEDPNAIAKYVRTMKATARGWAEVCVDLLITDICGRIDVTGTLDASVPTIDWKVEF
jgi:hypothetical protein